MSNYFILISDRPIKSNLISHAIEIPKSIIEELQFVPTNAYKIEPTYNDRKELIAKQLAPELYHETEVWFNRLKKEICNVKANKGNVAVIETYYNQDLNEVIWFCEAFPIEKFSNEELSFDFDTIYII